MKIMPSGVFGFITHYDSAASLSVLNRPIHCARSQSGSPDALSRLEVETDTDGQRLRHSTPNSLSSSGVIWCDISTAYARFVVPRLIRQKFSESTRNQSFLVVQN